MHFQHQWTSHLLEWRGVAETLQDLQSFQLKTEAEVCWPQYGDNQCLICCVLKDANKMEAYKKLCVA